MEDFALTQEQQELAAENHNLIYRFAQAREINVEEFYDVLAIALCKAAKAYDQSRGLRFSTLAFRCMRNEYNMYWRHELNRRHIPPGSIVSYNTLISNESDENSQFLDIIANQTCDGVNDSGAIEVEEFIETLHPIQRDVLTYLMDGCKVPEIAEKIGCSRQYVYRVRRSIRTLWNNYSVKR
ncbi:MAG: sigma-70 family RNA polymerase sigma factor [Prevotella sp.]|nr:sigma-70 family RNA polymerase sigma factor [Prevotella sp.]